MTFEVIAAAALLRQLAPALRVRVVNVTDLMILSTSGSHPHALSKAAYETLFTADRPVHFNYHGYPIELRGLLGERNGVGRVSVAGYCEEGTTTSPFDVGFSYRLVIPLSLQGGVVFSFDTDVVGEPYVSV